MKFVNPSVEIIDQPNQLDKPEVLKFLEKIGRVCYRSEERITEESAVKFIQMLRDKRHWAMLEHFRFTMGCTEEFMASFNLDLIVNDPLDDWDIDEKLNYIRITYWAEGPEDQRYIVSGSATAFNYLWECSSIASDPDCAIARICHFLNRHYPELMKNPTDIDGKSVDLRGIRFLTMDEIDNLPLGIRMVHKAMTAKFGCDTGISHEFVRHRPVSVAHESTRYVNYGKREPEVIVPSEFPDNIRKLLLENHSDLNAYVENGILTEAYVKWLSGIDYAIQTYTDLVKDYDWKPQTARDDLPMNFKRDLVITTTFYYWRHFFKMRADSPAHPRAQALAYDLLHKAYVEHKEVFDDLEAKSRK